MTDNNQKHRKVKPDDLIVSKTDLEGNITYCNAEFMIYSGYYLEDLIGKQHMFIAHTDMPKSIFQEMWKSMEAIDEVCSLIKNQSNDGAYFWTFMNVTPSFDSNNKHIGYLFVQRSASDEAIAYFEELYQQMSATESKFENNEAGMDASYQLMENVAVPQGGHNEFVFSYYV